MAAELIPCVSTLISGAARDAAPFLAQLREREPVCWLEGFDAWLVTRHSDVRRLFTDARLSADPRDYERHRPIADPAVARWMAELPFRSTAADPQSLGRRLVSAALTPRAVARMEHVIRDVVEEFAAPLRGRAGCIDLIEEFTAPIAATVIARILGLPPRGEDEARFRRLARHATRGIQPFLSDKKREKTERATAEICEYVQGLVAERRAAPREDLISDLVAANESVAGAGSEDLVRVVAGIVSAGTGTTSLACSRALRTLLLHPHQLQLLRRDASLLPGAVLELMRYDSGLLAMPRYVLEDFELRGCRLRKGKLVVLSLMGANRDPRVFEDPDRLDLRRDTRNALSFGFGSHYCIGANIARAELLHMLDAALGFLPERAVLREDEIRWSQRGLMSQMKTLPVDFGTLSTARTSGLQRFHPDDPPAA